jgi:hypothetical protein
MRLTDDSIAAIRVPSGKSEVLIFDQDIAGFGVRVRRGGSVRFYFSVQTRQPAPPNDFSGRQRR